jgi:uncharacterized protein YggT (Ycf19 family)
MANVKEVRTTEREPERERRIFTFKATQLIWLLLGVLEALLALRILLKLMAANPGNAFAAFLYSITDIFLLPFVGLTATPAAGGMVLELSTFIAMLVYGLVGWGVERLVWVIFYRPRGASVSVTQTTTQDRPRQ